QLEEQKEKTDEEQLDIGRARVCCWVDHNRSVHHGRASSTRGKGSVSVPRRVVDPVQQEIACAEDECCVRWRWLFRFCDDAAAFDDCDPGFLRFSDRIEQASVFSFELIEPGKIHTVPTNSGSCR